MAARIRKATVDDAADIARLNLMFNEVDATPAQVAAWFALAHTETVFVAEWDGRIVGMACLQLTRSACYPNPLAELAELYIEPDHRRKGLGRALVARAEEAARSAGANEILLLTGLHKEDAQAFYRVLGYIDYALSMRKLLE